jgi:hypothetical protein
MNLYFIVLKYELHSVTRYFEINPRFLNHERDYWFCEFRRKLLHFGCNLSHW